MAGKTSIEWTRSEVGTPGSTWNPTTGCDRVSAGCDNCYALTLAKRLKAMGQARYQKDGNPKTSGPGFGLTLHPDVLTAPLHWRKPRRIFVDSMSDLFHADVPTEFIASVFAVMAAAPHHTFQVLTKRPRRMQRLMSEGLSLWEHVPDSVLASLGTTPGREFMDLWPLPNVWLGTSVENQEAAYRIDWLVRTPAAVRFLSCEPLIGPINLFPFVGCTHEAGTLVEEPEVWECDLCGARQRAIRDPDGPIIRFDAVSREEYPIRYESVARGRSIDWIIVGGESGPGFRPVDPQWVRDLRDQCVAAQAPFFFKQWGGRTPKAGGRELDGRTWDEIPKVRS